MDKAMVSVKPHYVGAQYGRAVVFGEIGGRYQYQCSQGVGKDVGSHGWAFTKKEGGEK